MTVPNQTQQLLDLAQKLVNLSTSILGDVNQIQGAYDEYLAITAVTPYTDPLFVGTPLAYLNAYNLGVLMTVLLAFLQVYNDQVNYTANGGRNKNIMNLCQP